MVVMMISEQMGKPCVHINGSFSSNFSGNPFCIYRFEIFKTPRFSIGLNSKHVVRVNLGAVTAVPRGETDNRSVGGELLERDFKFKPSFDEYLKAMELAKSVRDRKLQASDTRHKSKNDLPEISDPRKAAIEEREKKAKLREFEGNLKKRKAPDVLEEDEFSESADDLYAKGNCMGAKVKSNLEGVKANGKWSKKQTSDADVKLDNAMLGRSRDVEETPALPDTLGKWSKKQTNDADVKLDNAMLGRSRDVEETPALPDPLKELGQCENSLNMLKSVSQTSREEHGAVRNETSGRLVSSGLVVKEFSNRKIAPQTRNRHNFLQKIDDDKGLEIERAAFRTFDDNDINDKPRVSRVAMEERIQKLAMMLNGADVDMPEWMFSKMMRSAKIRFSDHSIMRVIQILGDHGNWRRVLQVIEWLEMRERFESHKLRYIYTAALNVMGRARRPVEALNVFHSMQQQLSSYPDMVAYHSIAITLGQAGHMKELFYVIDSMRSPPKKKFRTGALEKWDPLLEPDIVIYNAVLNACVRRKQWEGAFWVLQQLKKQGQQPSGTTYGLVMEVMLACGKYNLVHEFFRKAQKSSLPNAMTYKVLVNTLWREGKTDEAVLIVQDMERRGIVGCAAVYYDLSRCLCSAGRCQEALLQIEKICKVANKPLVVTYTGLIQACLDSGNVQNGAYIFSHMQKFCSPNLVTCNILMKGYLEDGMFEEAKRLFQKMSENGFHNSRISGHKTQVAPDIYTFNTILETCISEKRWDDFEFFYNRMLSHEYHFNAKRHLRMILEASRAGKGELLETTWKHLIRTGRVPPSSLVKERFLMKLEKSDYASALSCISSHAATDELQAFSKTAWLSLFKENDERLQQKIVVELIHEVSKITVKSDSVNPVFRNLVAACKEYTCSALNS